MAADAGERTEAPTSKRRGDARRQGEVAQSKDLASVVLIAVALIAVGGSAMGALGASVTGQMTSLLSGAELRPETLGDFHAVLLHHGLETTRAMAPLVGILMLAGLLVHQLQTGPLWASEVVAFKGSRLDPLKGLARFAKPESLMELPKATVKVVVVGFAIWGFMQNEIGTLLGLADAEVGTTFDLTVHLVRELTRRILIVLGVFAVLDLAWVRWRFEKNLRMTKQEVREEMLQREGSPQIRARRRQKQIELSRMRMIAQVATADVVVVNPTHFAVALRYVRSEMRAPKVVAKGRNHFALRIRRVAEESGVPVIENPPLAQILYKTSVVDREIPDTLYQAVAEVLAHVARLAPGRASAWRGA